MKLSALVHPFVYYNKVDSGKKNEIDSFIDCAKKILIFYSYINTNERLKYYSLSNYSLNEAKNKPNCIMIPTYFSAGMVSNYAKAKIKSSIAPMNIEELIFAGQTIDFTKNGQCVGGIIDLMDSLTVKSARFVLENSLLSSMEGFGSRLNEECDISSIYDYNREIVLR